MSELARLLETLERTVDPERQRRIDTLHVRALEGEPVKRLPLVMQYPLPADGPFRPFPHREIFTDPGKMLYNELVHAFETSIACGGPVEDDLPLTVRANFGTVLIASLFGVRVEQVGDNPPWVRPFRTAEEFRRAVDEGHGDCTTGWAPRVIETYGFYREALAAYPKLEAAVRLVLPDLQGPLDTVELMRGSSLFLDLHDDPELVHRALSAAARAQIDFARRLALLVRDGPPGFAHQHATAIRGSLLIRTDSAILLSPELYREHVAPHDTAVLEALGGGGIHSCGRLDRHAEAFLELPALRSLDLGQPELNDLDTLYARARARGVALVRASVDEAELTSGRVMERFPTGVSLVHRAASVAEAQRIAMAYRTAAGTWHQGRN